MNERRKRKTTTPRTTIEESDIQQTPSRTEDSIRPEEPTDTTIRVAPSTSVSGGILPQLSDRLAESLFVPSSEGTPAPPALTEQEAVQTLRRDLGIEAIERALNNLIQEQQARNNAIQPSNGGTSATGLAGVIGNIANAIATGLSRLPTGQNTEGQLLQRLLDMTLNHYAVIDQVYLKQAGLPAINPRHVTMTT